MYFSLSAKIDFSYKNFTYFSKGNKEREMFSFSPRCNYFCLESSARFAKNICWPLKTYFKTQPWSIKNINNNKHFDY